MFSALVWCGAPDCSSAYKQAPASPRRIAVKQPLFVWNACRRYLQRMRIRCGSLETRPTSSRASNSCGKHAFTYSKQTYNDGRNKKIIIRKALYTVFAVCLGACEQRKSIIFPTTPPATTNPQRACENERVTCAKAEWNRHEHDIRLCAMFCDFTTNEFVHLTYGIRSARCRTCFNHPIICLTRTNNQPTCATLHDK